MMKSYLILPSWFAPLRNGDVHYSFRVDSDFLAWIQMDIEWAIFVKNLDFSYGEEILFFDEPSDTKRLWESVIWDRERIRGSGFTWEIRGYDEIYSFLDEHKDDSIFLPSREAGSSIFPVLEKLRSQIPESNLKDASQILLEKRIYKTEKDIFCIREAISITKQAFDYVRSIIRHWMYEYEIEAEFAYFFRKNNMAEAYPTIVASGPNACTLHYTRHDRKIEDGDFVLIDVGAEYKGFAADITRTLSVWEISFRQNEILQSVIHVKEYAESLLHPGIKKSEYEIEVRTRMNVELRKLWLMKTWISADEEMRISRKYYPHSTSHFLGLDVHDVGSRDAILESGMVVTCEPGIYIPEEGIGIRLEDDILITENGCENLSISQEIK